MKASVGNTVIIKHGNSDTNCLSYVPDMTYYEGRIAVITRIIGRGRFRIDIDGETWIWDEKWVEEYAFCEVKG